jgi:hypothetical protein
MAYGLQYDGGNDLVNIASPVTIGFGNDGSITVPFKRNDTSNGQALFGNQSGTSNICQILNNSQLFFRVNSSSITLNLTTPLVLNGEYIFKFKRVSNVWSLVDEFDSALAPETVMNNNAVTIDQVGAFNGGTLFHGRMDGFVIEELGTDLQSLINTTGTGSVWPDSIGSADGTLVNFPTDDSQWVNLGGSGISITATLGTIDYASQNTTVALSGSIDVSTTLGAISYSSQSTTVSITGDLDVTATLGSIDYSSQNTTISVTGDVDVIATLGSINYSSNGTVVSLTSETIVNATLGSIDYASQSAVVTLSGLIDITPTLGAIVYNSYPVTVQVGAGQAISNVRAGFADDIYTAGFKPDTITVNFK